MLINQIIPHHHHDSKICFEEQSSCCSNHHNEENQENGNSEDNCALCGIVHALFAPGQSEKSSLHPTVIPLNVFHNHVVIPDNEIVIVQATSGFDESHQTLPLLQSVYQSTGTLRAPPYSV